MPLAINSLGGGDTHTHAYRHRGQKQFQETSHALAFGQHAPGLKSIQNDEEPQSLKIQIKITRI